MELGFIPERAITALKCVYKDRVGYCTSVDTCGGEAKTYKDGVYNQLGLRGCPGKDICCLNGIPKDQELLLYYCLGIIALGCSMVAVDYLFFGGSTRRKVQRKKV